MGLTTGLIIVIFALYVFAKSGQNPAQKKLDAEHKKKMDAEHEQRILNARIREQFEKARVK